MEKIKEMAHDILGCNRQMTAGTEALNARVELLKNYTRKNNFVVSGIPMADGENPLEVAMVGEGMGIKIVPSEIDIVHRLPMRGDRSGSSFTLKFTNCHERNEEIM